MPKVSEVIASIEAYAPLSLQESWDNSGLQVGHPEREVTGVLVALDPTPERIDEALSLGANMVVSHHPLIFKGLKKLTDENRVQRAVESAILNGVAVYSSHTSLDNAEYGVSALVAAIMKAKIDGPLIPLAPGSKCGTGVLGRIPSLSPETFVAKVKEVLGLKVVRTSDPALCAQKIDRFAVCGGSGGGFIADAVAAGAQAYITGDIRYHDFIDFADKIFLVDCGHFETEMLCRNLLARLIREAFPELPVHISEKENNPVFYQ